MEKYWLIVESYVFIWKDSNLVLIYNSLLQRGFVLTLNSIIEPIVDLILAKENLRVVEIDQKFYLSKEGHLFILKLRDNYSGDVFAQSAFPYKPIVVLPEVNINEDVNRVESNQKDIYGFGSQISMNLMEVTIQLTGNCNNNCSNCGKANLQHLWCCKNQNTLTIKELDNIFEKLQKMHLFRMNFIGGNVLCYPYWDQIFSSLKHIQLKKCIYLTISCLYGNEDKLEYFLKNDYSIYFLIDCSNDVVERIYLNESYNYIFLIASIEDYEKVCNILKNINLSMTLLPLYTKSNENFFKMFVYQNLEDILTTEWRQKDIFANQVLNSNFFGKFYISATGEIYTDLNLPAIGTISSDFSELIYNEIYGGKTWRRTRDQILPCNTCIYKYLCPPLSNYETVIGVNNLCHIIKNE